MRNRVLSILPTASLDLLEIIEEFAGLEVKFAGREEFPDQTDTGEATEAASIHSDSATVFVLGDEPTPAGITHELHHIQRYWCEMIPQIVPHFNHPHNWTMTGMIEDALEHIIIIPKDAAIGFPNSEHWNNCLRPYWDTYPWPLVKDKVVRRMHVFSGWLNCMEHATDHNIIALAAECISKEGLFDDAKKFHTSIRECIHHKPSAIAQFLKYTGLPHGKFGLVTFDIRNRQRITEVVPEC